MSNVTGTNLDLLRVFLNLLSGRMHCNQDKPAEFQIDETYSVPVRISQTACLGAIFWAEYAKHFENFV